MNSSKKLSLSKETLRSLSASPMTQDEVTLVGGATATNCGEPLNTLNCPPGSANCGGTTAGSCGCNSYAGCAGSTGCNSTTHACPER